jgi:hypothetical protein
MWSAGLVLRRHPKRGGVGGRSPSEDATVLFRGGQRVGGTGVGSTVSWNDTGLPAQRRGWPHSAGWSNSAGI